MNGTPCNAVLMQFDPNALGLVADTVTCVGMEGQHTVSSAAAPRTLTVTVTWTGIRSRSDTERTMYSLRRELLRAFPLGEAGEVEYTNGADVYYLTAYASEIPVVERTVGTFCKATVYLTADYPFWHKDILSLPYTVGARDAIAICVPAGFGGRADMDSPVIINVTCTEQLSDEVEAGRKHYFSIWENSRSAGESELRVVKPLKRDELLTISTGLNNEIYVRLTGSDGKVHNASNYVEFLSSDFLKKRVSGDTVWQVNTLFLSGEISVQMCYQNIYRAV